MVRLYRLCLIHFFFVALATGCATTTNPVTGERELQGMTTQQEMAVGKKESARVASEMGLVQNPTLRSYIQALGGRLAPFSPRQDLPYTFDIVEMKEPNAFALPGGYIYVSRGLLVIANSEDELAGVIGHEIGHVAARHHAQRQTRSQAVGIATVLGTIAAGVLGGSNAAQAVGQIGQVAGAGLIASYGRDQERQSDDVGQRIAAQAGYDPGAIGDFLETLGRAATLETGQERQPSFFDSHPSTPERVRNTRELAASLHTAPARPIAGTRKTFLRKLEGITVDEDPAQGIFQGERFLHPDLNFVLQFPSGWKTVNTPQVVGAQEPQGQGVLKFQLQGAGSDPQAAANQFASEANLQLEQGSSLRVGGLPAWRAYTRANNGNIAQFTWIADQGRIYRIDGIATANAYQSLRNDLDASARSFRHLTRQERDGIRKKVLQVVVARAGETLVELGRRTGNAWTPQETAVANGVPLNVRFEQGFAVKIAKEQPYQSP